MQPNNAFLGTERISRLLFRLAIPAVTAQIVNMLYNMVDRIYIGHIDVIGADALTGLGVCNPLIIAISAFAALVCMGASPTVSRFMGEGDNAKAEKVIGTSATVLIIVALILTVVMEIFCTPLLYAFGASDITIKYAVEYLRIYAIGTIFVQITLGLNTFITAQGFAKTGMFTVIIGAVLNIILDPIFIFVFDMGVSGAALATIISQFVSASWVVIFLCGKKSILKLRLSNMKPDFKILARSMALGISPFIMQITESVLFLSFNSSLLKYGGDTAVGAMTILTSVMQFCMLPLTGFTQGASPILGYNLGAGNPQRLKDTFSLLLKVCLIYATILWLLIMLFPNTIAEIFTSDASLRDYAAWAMRIYMAGTFMFGAQISCQMAFVSLGNAKYSIFLAVLRKIILLIPLIFILPHIFTADKCMAVFLAEPVSDILAAITTSTLFYIQFKKVLKSLSDK
ncbi:MAG: MATE family efflux transporter [Oscillospiraceae bacterium]|nr:MATE family efflux transporter [Oscillospiraceae bacterium]